MRPIIRSFAFLESNFEFVVKTVVSATAFPKKMKNVIYITFTSENRIQIIENYTSEGTRKMFKRVIEFMASFKTKNNQRDWISLRGDLRFYLVERNAVSLEL